MTRYDLKLQEHIRRASAVAAELYPAVSQWVPNVLIICAAMLLLDAHLLQDYLARPVHLAAAFIPLDFADGSSGFVTNPEVLEDPIAAATSLAAIFAGFAMVAVTFVSVLDVTLRLGALLHWRRVRRETRRISAG